MSVKRIIPDGYCKTCGAQPPLKICPFCKRTVCIDHAREHLCLGGAAIGGRLPVLGLDAVESAIDLIQDISVLGTVAKIQFFFEHILPDGNPMLDGYHRIVIDVGVYVAERIPQKIREQVVIFLEGMDKPFTLEGWLRENKEDALDLTVPLALPFLK